MKKIMFNDKYGLTQAVLDGRKTMTRREITNKVAIAHCDKGYTDLALNYAQYQVGEVVAIAQSYHDCGCLFPKIKDEAGDYNKMFVKADLMPHHIRITNIRVERLQDISDEDCLREGIYHDGTWYRYANDNGYASCRNAFSNLIDKVSGKGTWERNHYVFVYEFEKVD